MQEFKSKIVHVMTDVTNQLGENISVMKDIQDGVNMLAKHVNQIKTDIQMALHIQVMTSSLSRELTLVSTSGFEGGVHMIAVNSLPHLFDFSPVSDNFQLNFSHIERKWKERKSEMMRDLSDINDISFSYFIVALVSGSVAFFSTLILISLIIWFCKRRM